MSEKSSLNDFIEDQSDSEGEKKGARFGPVSVEFPAEWKFCKMQTLYREKSIGTSERGEGDKENIPLIKMGDIGRGNLSIDEPEMVEKTENLFEQYSLKKGDLLFNTRNTPELVGKTAVWDGRYPAIYDNNLMRVRFKSNITPTFVNYFLSSKIGWRQLRSRVHGTTSVAAIYDGEFDKIKIPVPDLEEQYKISAVLSTIDKLIQKVKEIIEQIERVKSGILQDQFHIDKYDKDSLIKIEELGKWGSGSTPSKKNKQFWGSDIPWLSPKDVFVQENNRIDKTGSYLTQEGASKTNIYPEDSIAVVVRSGVLDRMLPVAKIEREMAVNQDIKILEPELAHPEFLLYAFEAHSGKIRQRSRKQGTTWVDSIQMLPFMRYQLPIPDEERQLEVIDTLKPFDELLSNERKTLNTLKNIRKGLMQDLLTGTVRTINTTIQVPDEVAQHG